MLNLGCIGDGPRPILGDLAPAKKAYTVIEIPVKRAKDFKYTTWIPTSNEKLELNALPDSVVGFNGMIKRCDQAYKP